MKHKIITAIAFNTLGAAIIVFGARFPNRIAAIAISSLGTGVTALGFASLILMYEKEVGESRQETLQWAQEAQQHLQDKRDLLLQFEDLKTRIEDAEDQYAIATSIIEPDEETIKKWDRAELN